MNVALIAPLSIAAVNGGVRTQVMQTAAHLTTLGINVEIVAPEKRFLPSEYDIIHLFAAGAETSHLAALVRRQAKLVVSPVFFSNRKAGIIRNSVRLEKLLKIFGSGIRSDFSIKAEICRQADLLLPNTSEEQRLVCEGFGIPVSKTIIVPNGVNERFAGAKPDLFVEKYGIKDFILFAGHAAAPRKNVMNLLQAAGQFNKKLVVIGSFDNSAYSRQCLSLAAANPDILLIETLEHDSELLASAYAACSVFVLPSFYETPGIAALEAALAGANIAITQHGGTKDYFQNKAFYLNPRNTESIIKAVNDAAASAPGPALKAVILEQYTWQKIAEKTVSAYNRLLKETA